MEYFTTLHIETNKSISIEEADNEIERLLRENGYTVVGTVQSTEISSAVGRSPQKCLDAWKNHYNALKRAW